MIFRPVSPESPCGPPITKRPVGLIKNSVSDESNSCGREGLITSSLIKSRMVSFVTSAACWVDTTTFLMPTIFPPSYCNATWDLQSGRNQGAFFPACRRSAMRRKMR